MCQNQLPISKTANNDVLRFLQSKLSWRYQGKVTVTEHCPTKLPYKGLISTQKSTPLNAEQTGTERKENDEEIQRKCRLTNLKSGCINRVLRTPNLILIFPNCYHRKQSVQDRLKARWAALKGDDHNASSCTRKPGTSKYNSE